MTYVKIKHSKLMEKINQIPNYDGGRDIVDRLIRIFGVRNRLELADLLEMNPGSLSTWSTRNTTPFELLIRIHLITGLPMQYLCFGEGEEDVEPLQLNEQQPPQYVDGKVLNPTIDTENHQNEELSLFNLKTFSIDSGVLEALSEITANKFLLSFAGVKALDGDMAIVSNNKLMFIDSTKCRVNTGTYLFSVNETYQLGELLRLPDDKVYLLIKDQQFPLDPNTTVIHGKVVSELECL
ncbi:helix-turn-helix transcriptional regulator [Shewanella algae]|uniref:helix-turn-helix transcriptional regulator n=1 Tax=Shewanella algae TaxID=38313 RepID=UPI001AADBE3A|nr:helix-turn-helix transcriptional regulator [Shewanella algae]MBO2682978.1 helix-turn-helix domain containing protein [Shewanella algae]